MPFLMPRFRCHKPQITKTRIVSGIAIVGKYHQFDATLSLEFPYSSVMESKKTVLKMALKSSLVIFILEFFRR